MPADVVWTLDGDESSWAEWASARATAAASPLVRELIAAQPPAAGGWALDLGSGTGRAFAPLVEAGYRVVGVDPTAQAVAASRERADREGLPAWSLQASAARLPLTAGAIPFLFAVGTLYHLSPRELAAALGEVWRVLQPSGQAVLHFLDMTTGDPAWRLALRPVRRRCLPTVPSSPALLRRGPYGAGSRPAVSRSSPSICAPA
jgi:SAM-dependent methyltransferase